MAARFLKARGFEPVLFERGPGVGGLWRRTAASGIWPDMRANTSRTMTRFSDLDYPDGTPAFPHNEQVRAYLEAYAQKVGLLPAVRPATTVTRIGRDPAGGYVLRLTDAAGKASRRAFARVVGEATRGFVVIEPNIRGSTGYGRAWTDALKHRVGLIELEDIAAVREWAVGSGFADPDRLVLTGGSWGGYLTLLGLGTQPEAWTLGIAAVPVADYVTAYHDEMEALKAMDRTLLGGTPEEVPERFEASSPLTYVDRVRAPVLVLAGENDPRCPIRQVDNYLDALAARADLPFEVTRFDAGHGSMVVDQTVAHVATEVGFARRALGGGPIGGRVAQGTTIGGNVTLP